MGTGQVFEGGKFEGGKFEGGTKGNVASVDPVELDAAGSKLYQSLLPAVQRWVQIQASVLVGRGDFGSTAQRGLKQYAATTFPAEDSSRIALAVRYMALKQSAGGSMRGVFNSRTGMTPLQKQLLVGVPVRA
jgi:hypothetical protein